MARYIGLSKAARQFLKDNNRKVLCKWRMGADLCLDDIYGMVYEVADRGKTYAETIQSTVGFDKPSVYTALRDISTGDVFFQWEDSEII